MLFWLIKISLFFTLTLASPVDRRAVQPADDPFYTPYPGWESQRPGTILATREILAAQLGFLPTGSVKTYQLLYKTLDQDDRPLASVTTILVPLVRANDRFVSYSVAEDSGNSKCAPSYQYQFGSDASNAIAQAELLVLQTALSQGWIVSIPDYQGPNSAWISGRLQGRSVLDSIRATLSHPPLGFNSGTKVGLWGYSGGANAVGWAASLHPTYASELNIVGVAQGGTPANITAAALLLDGSPFSGFVPIAFHGLGAGYPQFKQRIDQVITPAFQSALDVARSKCAVDLLLAYGNTAFFPGNTYFNGTGFALLDDPIIKPILDSLTLGSTGKGETPRAPLLVYHSGNDQVVPYPPAVTMVNNYCANGATVQFVTNTDSSVGHVLQEPLAIPRVIAYLRDRFDGKPISGCQRVQVGVSSTAGAIADAIQFGLPGLSGLITAAIAVFQTLPAV